MRAVGSIANKKAALICVVFLFLTSGCAVSEPFGGSRKNAINWASARGFEECLLPARPFHLLALMRRQRNNAEVLTVYIEGDGAPWATPWHPPRDPTPLKPIGLALAAGDTTANVVYLGRPCQYLDSEELATCDPAWWITHRFSPKVLLAYDETLNQLKSTLGTQRFRLVGYSGGGVIAALLAARRSDVERFVTVAAPLSLHEWVAWHDLTPFAHSTPDPILETTGFPPSIHWAGEKDKIVPPTIVEHFVREKGGQLFTVPDYDHECCWVQAWPRLIDTGNMQ